MCWSLRASLATGALSYVCAYYLFRRRTTHRDRWHAIFLFTFSSMQWLEAALWATDAVNERCSATNVALSTWILPSLLTGEIYVQWACAGIYRLSLHDVQLSPAWRWCLLMVGIAWVGPIAHLRAPAYFGPRPYCTTVQHTALRWISTERQIPEPLICMWVAAITAPLLAMKPLAAGATFAIAGSSLALGVYLTVGNGVFGSRWCWISCWLGLLMLLDPWLFGSAVPGAPLRKTR